MRAWVYVKRTTTEILLDPLTIIFGLGFPLVILGLLTLINRNVPVSMPDFALERLTPGVTVFGMSFLTLFSALLLSKDRGTSLLQRLFTTPLKPVDYILGYAVPMLPIAVAESAVCYLFAMLLGMQFSVNILISLATSLLISLLFIAMGLLFGAILNEKQVGGLCGTLVTNLTAWLSGIWFSIDLLGPVKYVAKCLPFYHAVELQRAVIAGNFGELLPHMCWVLGYTAVIAVLAVILFMSRMKEK